MLHLAGGVGVGGDVGDLLELERALQRHRQSHVAAQVEEEARLPVLGGDGPHRLVDPRDQLAHVVGKLLEPGDQGAPALGRERAAQLGQAQRQQVHRGDLADERLGGRNPDLQAAAARVAKIYAAGDVLAEPGLLAMNVLLDQDAEHRNSQIAKLKTTLGNCGAAEPIKNRRLEQKLLNVRGLLCQHLVDEIVEDEAVAAAQGCDEA